MKARLPEGYAPPKKSDMMRQYQQLQEKMAATQEELKAKEYTGSAGGGMASAVVNGEHTVLSVSLKPEIVDPSDTEMLCDLVAAAVNDAIRLANEDSAERMGALTGGLDLGGMLG